MINSFESFKDDVPREFEYYCYKNCLRLLYKYYGEKVPMQKIFCGKIFSIDNGVLISDTNDNGIISPDCGNIQEYSIDNLSIQEITIKDREFLEEGKPVIIAVDPYFLPYSKYYMERHAYHTVILISFLERSESAHILDWYLDEKYDGEISMSNLNSARLSKNEGDGIMNFSPIKSKSFVLTPSNSKTTNLGMDLYSYCRRVVPNFYLEGWTALMAAEKNYMKILQGQKDDWDKRFHSTFKELIFLNTRTELENYYYKSVRELLLLTSLDAVIFKNDEVIDKLKTVKAVATKLSFAYSPKIITDFLQYFREYLILERNKYSQLAEVMFKLESWR